MEIHRRPLSRSERKELEGIVSISATIGRAVFFMLVVGLLALLCRKINGATPSILWWPYPATAAAIGLFFAAKRMTGGTELRRKIRMDLQAGEAEDRFFALGLVVVFPEVEDEGPVWFFRDGSQVYCLSGQRIDRLARGGLPPGKVLVSLAPASERILQLKSQGEKADTLVSRVPFFESSFYDKRFLSKTLTAVSLDWDQLVASVQRDKV